MSDPVALERLYQCISDSRLTFVRTSAARAPLAIDWGAHEIRVLMISSLQTHLACRPLLLRILQVRSGGVCPSRLMER